MHASLYVLTINTIIFVSDMLSLKVLSQLVSTCVVHLQVVTAAEGTNYSVLLHFTCLTRKTTGAHWIGGWVGSRAGLDDVKRRKILPLSGLEFQSFSRRARSQLLYRLRYPGS
jgi:hypothetical protein